MKKLFLILSALSFLVANAVEERKIYVVTDDMVVFQSATSEIDSIVFYPPVGEIRTMYVMKDDAVMFQTSTAEIDSLIFYQPPISIHSDDISRGELLDLNKTVNFYYQSAQEITQGVWTLEVPTENGEYISIFTQEIEGVNFTVTTPGHIDAFIPNLGDDYLRTASAMLDARVRLTGSYANGAVVTGTYAIELPYRPTVPTLEVCGVEDDFENWESSVTLCYRSAGVTHYWVGRRLLIGSSITIYHPGDADNITLHGVYLDMDYEFRVQAYNQYGYSTETRIYIDGNQDYYTNY